MLQAGALSVEVALESRHGQHLYASTVLDGIGGSWRNFRATLTSNATDSTARLAIRLKVRPPSCHSNISCTAAVLYLFQVEVLLENRKIQEGQT